MKTFDMETFNKHKTNDAYSFRTEDNYEIQQIQAGTGEDMIYVEYRIPPNPHYFYEYREFYFNGSLKKVGERFKSGKFQKGIWKEYDKLGTLINEINYDQPYKFTFEQLVKLIENEKDTIDLFSPHTIITRSKDETGMFWYIRYKKIPMRRELIVVDGITGNIVNREHYPHEDN